MTSNRFAKPSNFASRIRTPLLRQHFVYRAYDKRGTLLYVGCSMNVKARMREHRLSTGPAWARQYTRLTLSGPYNYEVARDLERQAVWTEAPLCNGLAPGYQARRAAQGLWA